MSLPWWNSVEAGWYVGIYLVIGGFVFLSSVWLFDYLKHRRDWKKDWRSNLSIWCFLAFLLCEGIGIPYAWHTHRLEVASAAKWQNKQNDSEREIGSLGTQVAQAQWDGFRRELSDASIKTAVPELLNFKGQKFRVLPITSDSECLDLANSVDDVLQISSAWIDDETIYSIPGAAQLIKAPDGWPRFVNFQPPGETSAWLTICTHTQESPRLLSAIGALADLVEPHICERLNDDRIAPDTMLIVVNAKPATPGPWDKNRVAVGIRLVPVDNILPFNINFLNTIKRFPQQPFTLYIPKHDPDANLFADCFSLVFVSYGWSQTGLCREAYALDFGKVRVEIGSADKSGDVALAAESLLADFKKIGYVQENEAVKIVDESTNPKGDIAIRIGLIPSIEAAQPPSDFPPMPPRPQ